MDFDTRRLLDIPWVVRRTRAVLALVAGLLLACFAIPVAASGSPTDSQTDSPARDAPGQVRLGEAPPALIEAVRRSLAASDGASGDWFGRSVAVDGDTAVVGAPYAGGELSDGLAYVFVRSGTTWIEQATLAISEEADFDFFGSSVDIDGDTIVVGAPYRYWSQGRAYVFVRSGTTWSQQADLLATGVVPLDEFGAAVAVDGDTVLVGAPAYGKGAFVFVRSGTTWTEQASLAMLVPTGGEGFGRSVAVDGDTAVVGEPAYSEEAGRAYVFIRSGTTWTVQAELTSFDGAVGDLFGWSLALDGDTAVVGAQWHETSAGTLAGAAYVFTRHGTEWAEQAELTAPDGAAEDRFGYSVALSGRTLVIGATRGDTAAGIDAGSAYLFTRHGAAWTHPVELFAPDGAPDDRFGISVAVSGHAAVVGAYADDTTNGIDAGSAHLLVVRQL